VWVEVAEQIRNPATFDFLVESVGRAKLPDGMFYRFTIIFNPWRSRHWLNGRFFDGGTEIAEGEKYHINKVTHDTLAMTTTYLCNEWIDKDYANMMLEMKKRDPDRYKVAGLGQWGNEFGNTIFKRIMRGGNDKGWFVNDDDEEFPHEWNEADFHTRVGLDFGYSVDPTAIIYLKINYPDRQIAIMYEHFEKGMTNENIFAYFFNVGWHRLIVVGDKQNDKDMYRLKQLGMSKIQASFGGKIEYGLNLLHEFTISVHKNCVDMIDEFENYAWQRDKDGNMINKPIDEFNHGMDAIRYALQNFEFDFRKYLLLGGNDNLLGTNADPASRKEFLEFHKSRIRI
jgi:phage terminase large subunit